MSRILVFNPYTLMAFHTAYETTIVRGCQQRGAEVKYIICDGLFAECDIHSAAETGVGRPRGVCATCTASAREQLTSAGLSYEWLSQYVTVDERRAAFAWAQELSPQELANAEYMGHPVGMWVISSVASSLRVHEINWDDWQTVNHYRGYLHAAAVACIGLSRAMDDWKPDALLVFNGRRSVMRVAFNLATVRGIRTLIHERGLSAGGLTVVENATGISLKPFARFWDAWGKVPLSREEGAAVVDWLRGRRYQSSPTDIHFASAPQGTEQLKETLGLSTDRKLIAMFPGSTDESLGEAECTFPCGSQEAWIDRVVEWVADRDDCELVIRAHPCLSGEVTMFRAPRILDWFQALKSRLPANARLILPDEKLSSYDLMDAADLCLSYGSTAGVEMLSLGKPVVLASGMAPYQEVPEVLTFRDAEELEAVLDRALTLQPGRAYRRAAFRYIYRYYFHMQVQFPLVAMEGPWKTVLTYSSADALKQGADAGLDRICGFLMAGNEIFTPPGPVDLAALAAEEESLQAELEADPHWYQSGRPVPELRERIKRTIVKAVKPAFLGARTLFRPVGRMVKKLEDRIEAS